MINGMQEIKLTQSELSKRWDWENHQATLFGLKVKGLGIIQYQSAGGTLINEVTNILITIVAATAVLKGDMTLGMMLAVQFIIGQLNVPVKPDNRLFPYVTGCKNEPRQACGSS